MNIQQAFEIQKKISSSMVPENGYSQWLDKSSDEILLSIILLASLVGWDHEIIQDESSDEHEALIESIKKNRLVNGHDVLPRMAVFAYQFCIDIAESYQD